MNPMEFRRRAGWVESRQNDINRGWVSIYIAADQGIDVGRDPVTNRVPRYAVVCETHGTILAVGSIAGTRAVLRCPDFCDACMADAGVRS